VALDAALQLNPDDPLVRVKRAEYFYRLGQFGDAVGELEHAIQRPSFNFDLQRYANELLRKSREQAKRSFARAPLKFNLQWSRL
jgi:predicted Zn-dependent protease